MHGKLLVVERSRSLVTSVELPKDVSAESGFNLIKIVVCCFIVQAYCMSYP